MSLGVLAIIAGLLQALGYFIYVKKSLKHEVEPNPTTWLMFAYGTSILTVLEFDLEASWMILVLPIICSVLSVFVALLCLKRGTLRWPEKKVDRSAFMIDLALTCAYLSVWYLTSESYLSEEQKGVLVVLFLVLTNASTVVSFAPLIKGAIDDPHLEHPLPWLVWACAYGTLGYVTFYESGLVSEFMIYPALNTLLHASVGIVAIRRWFRPRAPLSP